MPSAAELTAAVRWLAHGERDSRKRLHPAVLPQAPLAVIVSNYHCSPQTVLLLPSCLVLNVFSSVSTPLGSGSTGQVTGVATAAQAFVDASREDVWPAN